MNTMRTKDMTGGNPLKLIIGFAMPLMLGNIFQQLYTVVDTAVVGKALGVDALAALGAVDWLNWMMLGIMQGVTQGFAILMARQFGARDYEQLRRSVGCSALLAAAGAVLLLALGQWLAEPMLLLLRTPEEILPMSLLYLRLMFGGIPIVMAYNLFSSILRAMGDGKTPLVAMIAAAFTNIGLDLLFVLVFDWGIAGAAVATLIAQVLSGLMCLGQIRKLEILRLTRADLGLRGRALRLLGLSAPMALQNAVIAIGGMIIQLVVNGFGVLFIAGFTASNKLYGVLEIAATSYGYALITYTGQNLGAGKLDRIRRGMRAAAAVAVATSLLIGGLMLLFGRGILGLFISGTPEEAAGAMEVAYEYLAVMSVCLPVLYLLHAYRSGIQGLGNTVLPMLSGMAEFVMRTGMVFILPGLIGSQGVFYAEVSSWLGAVFILIPAYYAVYRRRTSIL